jgi:hypothetical protein
MHACIVPSYLMLHTPLCGLVALRQLYACVCMCSGSSTHVQMCALSVCALFY